MRFSRQIQKEHIKETFCNPKNSIARPYHDTSTFKKLTRQTYYYVKNSQPPMVINTKATLE
ncbi:MAG: hypothetical protein E7089_05770 [Bacteroidales bacterium]|nr:hypothetical protein [Bacteroidales bacterium]